jgi:hypothetical protein
MMIEHCGSRVESASVPRVRKVELLVVEMVAEFVTKRAQECTERSDFLPHSRPHPHPDHHGFGSVVSEKFCRPPFASSQRSRGEYPDAAHRDSVELRGSIQEFSTCTEDTRNLLSLHCRLDRLCDCRQGCIIRQVEPREPVASSKTGEVRVARGNVGEHGWRLHYCSELRFYPALRACPFLFSDSRLGMQSNHEQFRIT